MGNFARALHHLDMKDVKKKRLEKIAAQKLKEQKDAYEKKIIQEISKRYKSNWKREIYEGMTTGSAYSNTVAPVEGDGVVTTVDAIDASSYSGTINGFLSPSDSFDGNTGSVIRASGTGEGHGGFNVGDNYLAFQGTGTADAANTRFAVLNSIDSTEVDTLQIKAIVGNDLNGGEDPDETGEELRVMYKTPAMDHAQFLNTKPDGTILELGDDIIIPIGAAPNAGLNDYSISIPDYARAEGTQFILIQPFNSGVGFDNYGITEIKFQRKAPINVVVPLDSPEAISFVRVGTDEGDPKKRKKKLNDQLAASDEYTTNVLGNQFPGQGARVDGEDPFKSAPLTPDDVINASPVGKDEVKKSFSSFSADAATAEPEPTEPEPTTPSSQTTINPTNDEGEEINVKSFGNIAVQGADAANVDAQEPESIEPEPIEPDVTEPEAIEPEPPDENKTPEEVEEIENKKFNAKAEEGANTIDNVINFRLDQGLASLNAIARVTGVVINTAINIGAFAANVLGMKEANGFVSMFGKIQNSIDIARSVLSGKITNANILPQEIKTFADSMKLDEFQAKKIFISDVRHEYADDNIYVKDGKVYQNGDGKNKKGLYATPLANQGFKGVDVHGSGYAQMIIPKDGSEPYLHYYDHNYENLNNASDVNPTGGIVQSIDEIWSSLFGPEDYIAPDGKVYKGLGKANPVDIVAAGFKSISHVIHQLKSGNTKFLPTRLKSSMLTYFGSFDQVWEGLLNTSSLEGFPPGIHGSALTDFKVPLSKLPKETQEMIANHPLSWTPERMANMKEDDWIGEMQKRMEGKDYEDFDETMLAAMKDPDTGSTVDPEYLEKYQRFSFAQYDQKTGTHPDAKEGTVEYDYDRAVEELRKAQDSPEYDKATDAAYQEYQDILAEQEEKYAANEEKFGSTAQSNLWEKLVGPYYRAVQKASKGGSISMNDSTYQKMINGYKEYEKQVKVLEKKYAQGRDEIGDNYKKLSDEAYAKYEDTFTVRELDDGTTGMVNGGDFKTKNGKIIPGKRTLTAKEQARFEEIRAEYDEVQEYLYSNTDYMDNMYIPYVLYDVKTEFSEYGISGDNWSPEKKGDGVSKGDDPFVDPFANEIKPNLGAKPGDELASAEKGNYDLYMWMLKTYPNKPEAAEWYLKTGKTKNNPFLPQGAYVPLASTLRNLGSVASVGGVDATAAATAAASQRGRRKKKNKNNIMVAHYQPIGNHLLEKYANPNGDNYSLFERLKQKRFFNPNDIKPTFPENPPPQLDPKTGMHPNYGKNAKRYRKLDPISANAMPPTGDPETDALVDKQRTKPKSFFKFKKNVKENQKSNWRKELINEGEWQPVASTGPTNATTQTYGYFDSGFPVTNSETGQQATVKVSGLGGVEATPSTTTIDLGFGETMNVDAPNYNQLALAGVAQPILMKRQETGDTNKKLDASQKFAKKVGADVMMNARVDNQKTDDELRALQKQGYYEKKLGPLLGNMRDARELRMNEKLIKENEREYEIYKKNEATRAKHNKIIDSKIKPLLDQINSGSDEKIDLKTFYERGAVVNKDGTRGLMIRRETTGSLGLSITKTVITTFEGKNISTVGSVANREKLGMRGQGKMTEVAQIKDPRLLEYKMPVELEMWQSQSVDPTFATPRSVGAQIAAKAGVKSAFDMVNYYIDNHVLNFDPNFDPNKRINLTHLITDRTKNILQKGMDNLKPEIDAEIEKYKARIPKIGEKQARRFLEFELLGDGEEKQGLINSYFRSDSTINNKILQKIQRVDIFNSLGNDLGFNIDHYMKTGNYQFDSTYEFTSTLDMGVRVPYVGGITSILSAKYVAGQLHGETMMAVQNPMYYQVDIDSGIQPTSKEPSKTKPVSKQSKSKEPSKTAPVSKQPTSKEPSKAVKTIKKMAKTKSIGFDRDEPIVRRRKKKRVDK